MRVVLASVLLCATLAFGDEPAADHPADRTAIEAVINSLKTGKPASVLFTADADSDLAQLNAAQSAMAEAARQPWSETMPPKLVIDSIRFVTADVAIVDAANLQISSTMFRRTPVILVMRREGGGWKIASLRMPAASTVL